MGRGSDPNLAELDGPDPRGFFYSSGSDSQPVEAELHWSERDLFQGTGAWKLEMTDGNIYAMGKEGWFETTFPTPVSSGDRIMAGWRGTPVWAVLDGETPSEWKEYLADYRFLGNDKRAEQWAEEISELPAGKELIKESEPAEFIPQPKDNKNSPLGPFADIFKVFPEGRDGDTLRRAGELEADLTDMGAAAKLIHTPEWEWRILEDKRLLVATSGRGEPLALVRIF